MSTEDSNKNTVLPKPSRGPTRVDEKQAKEHEFIQHEFIQIEILPEGGYIVNAHYLGPGENEVYRNHSAHSEMEEALDKVSALGHFFMNRFKF